MSEEQKAENRAYNKMIAETRHLIYRATEIIAIICFIGAAIYPHYPVCLVLLMFTLFFAIISNSFCDD